MVNRCSIVLFFSAKPAIELLNRRVCHLFSTGSSVSTLRYLGRQTDHEKTTFFNALHTNNKTSSINVKNGNKIITKPHHRHSNS